MFHQTICNDVISLFNLIHKHVVSRHICCQFSVCKLLSTFFHVKSLFNFLEFDDLNDLKN